MHILANADIDNTHFYENLGHNGKKFYIAADTNTVSVGPGVYVDGPQCTWGRIDGQTGTISTVTAR